METLNYRGLRESRLQITRTQRYLFHSLRPFPLIQSLQLLRVCSEMAISFGALSALVAPEAPSLSNLLRRSSAPPSLRFVVTPRGGRVAILRAATSAAYFEPAAGKWEPRGLTKRRRVSPEMQAVVGVPEIPRTQALKQIWAYIKENNLQVEIFSSSFSVHCNS